MLPGRRLLDCDVVLEDDLWPVEAIHSLDRYGLVQLFSRVHFLTDGTLPDEKGNDFHVEVHRSAASRLVDGTIPDSFFPSRGGGSGIRLRCAAGMAWAARREIIGKHGFYDTWIVGGGDKLMFVSALGRYDEYISRLPMTDRLKEHFLDWARRFHATVRGRVGCLDGDLYHLWHGDLGSRQYAGRYELFRRFGYDPYSDISMNEQGVWQWSSDKPEMHAFVRDFFARRAGGTESKNRGRELRAGSGIDPDTTGIGKRTILERRATDTKRHPPHRERRFMSRKSNPID